MSLCKYYHEEKQEFNSKEIFPTRDKLSKAKILTAPYCVHDASPKTKDETGKLTCEGNIDKCPIK